MARFRKSTHARSEYTEGRHRFEHWYPDNTVYFITARSRDGFPAFASEEAKRVLWGRFDHSTKFCGTLGYLYVGENLGRMMQRIRGSFAKLVNDLVPERPLPFWRCENQNDYFDGCIRNDLQCRRAYGYTLRQAVRAGLVTDPRDYPHTRVHIDVEVGVARALEKRAFLPHVEYKRYSKQRLAR